MSGLLTSLNAARTALEVNQKSIEVVGNNIANVNTEGYSRQKAITEAYPSMNHGGFFIGQGVKIGDISREHDVYLEQQIKQKSTEFGYQQGLTLPLSQLETVFDISENNLSGDIDNFFDSLQELSANPSDMVQRNHVIQQGEVLATTFNSTYQELNSIQININDSISSKIGAINSQITAIADLNERIIAIETYNKTANGARDQRDLLAKELAQTLGAQSYEDSQGGLNVHLPGGQPLVQGVWSSTLVADVTGQKLDLSIEYGGSSKPLGVNDFGGEFDALVEIRDVFIPEVTADLDQLAYELSVQVNLQHQAGGTLDSEAGGDFFTMPPGYVASPPGPAPTATEYEGAARSISVAITDGAKIAAGMHPDNGTPAGTVAPGDNTNALLLSNVADTYLVDGNDSFNSLYANIAAKIGAESNQNQLSLAGAEDALVQLENFRDSAAGISLEEEMISLIQYQRGFESSAKFLSTIDEMMNTLLSIKN